LITALSPEQKAKKKLVSANQIKFVGVLKELDSLVGLKNLKEQIINQILFFIQDLKEPGMFLHTVLTGPPGSGKTTIVEILAKLYANMGILKSSNVVRANRASLIGEYLGSTAMKTKNVLRSANGGVLLIDEVYALGNPEGRDMYSKECIDTINQYLSEHVDEFVCIVAGYKQQVQDCFFCYNPGLERRFPWVFTIDEQTPEELAQIMKLQLGDWKFDNDVNDEYLKTVITDYKDQFTGNGGSTRTFLDKCKITLARRIFGMSNNSDQKSNSHKLIVKKDIQNTIKKLKKKEKAFNFLNTMYV
jgi:SpoVK/Ycf46/Vps4 family AAA+-type ATPase